MNTTWNLTGTPKYKETRLWTSARASWLGRAVRECRRCRREFWAWAQFEKVAPAKVQQLAESIAAIPVRALDSADEKKGGAHLLALHVWESGLNAAPAHPGHRFAGASLGRTAQPNGTYIQDYRGC